MSESEKILQSLFGNESEQELINALEILEEQIAGLEIPVYVFED